MPLNKTILRKITATPPDKAKKISDGGGLFILLTPQGGKYWRLAYRFNHKQKTISLGVYPAVSLEQARSLSLEVRQLLASGTDPAEYKKNLRRGVYTFEQAARDWWQTMQSRWRPEYSAKILRRLETMLFPRIGQKPMNDLQAADYHQPLREAAARGVVETAHRLAQYCNQIAAYAMNIGQARQNNAIFLTRTLPPARNRHYYAITDPQELNALLWAIERLNNPMARAALKFLAYTAVRSVELRAATWPEIDFYNSVWTIPASRMKMKREHTVPLSRQALAILNELKPYTENQRFIFFSPKSKTGHISSTALLGVLKKLGYGKGRMCLHGFRTTFSTLMNEQGNFRPEVIEAELAHLDKNAVRAAYNRAAYLDERRRLMQSWADFLDQCTLL